MSITADAATRRRALIAGAIGNAMEYYDFAVYAAVAPILAPLFFPTDDPIIGFLGVFGAYAVGFLARPLGGFVFGHYGDKVGRRITLQIVIMLMAFSTFMIGILPTYAIIGVAAPALLVLARLLQGFSAAGEIGGSSVFMVEYAPDSKRGFYGSMQQVGVGAGFLLGLVAGMLLTQVVSEETVSSWAWRIPFLLGILIGIVGLYLRLKLEDSPAFRALEAEHAVEGAPLLTLIRNNYKQLLIIMGFVAMWGSSYHLFAAYMPTYLSQNLDFELSTALILSVVGWVFFVAFIPLMGMLSDRVGRKPLLVGSVLGFIVFLYPIFLLMSQGNLISVVLALLAYSLLLATFSGAAIAALVELLPTGVRSSAFGVGYNVSITIFGGTAPFIAAFLISRTGNALSPAYYVILTAVITLIAVLSMRETYKAPL